MGLLNWKKDRPKSLIFQYGSNCDEHRLNDKNRLGGVAKDLGRAQTIGQYDIAFLFSTKQTPRASLLDRIPLWERMSHKYFGFHRDLAPEIAAQMLGGRIVWEARRGRQWAAIVSFDQVENASGGV